MSNIDINVDRRTENRMPISHPATSRCDKNKYFLGEKSALSRPMILLNTHNIICLEGDTRKKHVSGCSIYLCSNLSVFI